MTRRKSIWTGSWLQVLLAISLIMVGCSPAHHAAIELDKIAKSVDRYGFASIATPFLVGPTDGFEFNLDKSASEYFDLAMKPQGGVRTFSAEALDVQAAFKMNIEQALASIAQFNRAKSIASIQEAKRKAGIQKAMLESLVAVNPSFEENPLVKSVVGMLGVVAEQPEPSQDALPGFVPTTQPVESGPPIDEADRLALRAVGGSFTPGLGFPKGDFQISAREAILIASGDVMTQSLLSWFIHPERNKQGDYELFFCPTIVSVQPGHETRKGYLADITVNVDLARKNDGGLEFLSESFPHSSPPIQVAGVFPVIDSQVLDLVSSRRKLFSMAFDLALMGFGSQANLFIDYAKKLEQDAQTQTALTVGSAYTMGSTAFGFRVEPKFVALENPASINSTPGNILESKTFPAMAIVLVHRSYLTGKYGEDRTYKDSKGKPIDADGSAQRIVSSQRGSLKPGGGDKFDYLVFQTSIRWSPVEHGSAHGRFSEVESWKRALTLDKAEHWVGGDKKSWGQNINDGSYDLLYGGKVPTNRQVQHLASRSITLRKLALDSQALVRVWSTEPNDKVRVEAVHPRRGWSDQYTVLTIRGKGFYGNVKSVTVGGVLCAHVAPTDHTLLVAVPPWASTKDKLPDDLEGLGKALGLSKVADIPGSETLRSASSQPSIQAKGTGSTGHPEPLEAAELGRLQYLEKKLKKDGDLMGGELQEYQELLGHQTKYEAWLASSVAWAEIVIGAKVPVTIEKSLNDTFPKGQPAEAQIPTILQGQPNSTNIGWVVFDKKIGKGGSGGSQKEGRIEIGRDDNGQITSVATKGGFANGAQLLQLIKETLQASGHDFSFEVNAEGGLRLGSRGTATTKPAPTAPAK